MLADSRNIRYEDAMKEQESLMAFEEYMAIAKYKERQSKEDDPELEAILKQQL
jgi:hypothetical protein